MALICFRFRRRFETGLTSVKQPERSGTLLHMTAGITPFFGGKPPFSYRRFCERNENRIIICQSEGVSGEQRTGCAVFNSKRVIKYLSRSRIYCSNVQFVNCQSQSVLNSVKRMCIPVHNKKNMDIV